MDSENIMVTDNKKLLQDLGLPSDLVPEEAIITGIELSATHKGMTIKTYYVIQGEPFIELMEPKE